MKAQRTAKMLTNEPLMMSMFSIMTFQSALMHWKQDSSTLKQLSQELIQASENELNQLNSAISKYNSLPQCNDNISGKLIWSKGAAKLYEYGGSGEVVLVIPSLINKADILDMKHKSFVHALSNAGLKPYLLDWGIVSSYEQDFSIEDYIRNIISYALQICSKGKKVTLIGYCMGGFMALAAAKLNESFINKIVTLAMPWDFSCFNKIGCDLVDIICANNVVIPSHLIQKLFYLSAPYDVNSKYIKFAKGDFKEDDFLQIENWVNDNVPMAKKVFKECFGEIVQENLLLNNNWIIGGQVIAPTNLENKILSVSFQNDKVVRPESTLPFNSYSNVESLSIYAGHISPIINSKHKLAEKISQWIYE